MVGDLFAVCVFLSINFRMAEPIYVYHDSGAHDIHTDWFWSPSHWRTSYISPISLCVGKHVAATNTRSGIHVEDMLDAVFSYVAHVISNTQYVVIGK
jgi:hypothetical protein